MKVSPEIASKWKTLIEDEAFPKIKDSYRRAATAILLENQEREMFTDPGMRQLLVESTAPNVSANFGGPVSSNTTNVSGYDPVLINLVRRSMPNLIAYDICGVQPMTMPTGLIFALRSKYIAGGQAAVPAGLQTLPETFYNEVNTAFSGQGTQSGSTPAALNNGGAYAYGTGMPTITGETLGIAGNAFQEMGFTIEKISVQANTRALKAEYTSELAQDLKSVHGLDAESELSNILQSEILAEINREIVRTAYVIAKPGAQNTDLTTPGYFDLNLDSNGRWSVEKFKGLLFQIEREANQIARDTRRGRGNIVICSSDVASALSMAGVLDYAPALSTGLEVDDTGNTFAGILQGKFKVYIDPYAVASTPSPEAHAGFNFFVVGYRGTSQYDAGFFYCPYVPLQMYKTLDSDTLQPKIAFKTRYGMVANPFSQGLTQGFGAMNPGTNVYYRRVNVLNLTGTATI